MKICTSVHSTKEAAEYALRRINPRYKPELVHTGDRWLVVCPQLRDLNQ